MSSRRDVTYPSRMLRIALLLGLGCMLSACSAVPSSDESLDEALQANYESRLFALSLSRQRHYAQRLYRISGDDAYVPINVAYAAQLAVTLQRDVDGLERPNYAMHRSLGMVEAYPTRTEKQRRRKPMLAASGEIPFAKDLLFRLAQARDYGLLASPVFDHHTQALDYLKSVDFRAFLLDPEVIALYAAQTANMAHYLHDLGITDLRRDYIATFRAIYPPSRDATLSNAEFRNKIYGMTHWVIAASGYYQRTLNAREFDWVLGYFAANIERIIAQTKADIVTEVGVSFQLAGQHDHPVVTRVKQALRQIYDPVAHMIPSESGGTDFAYGEHRNVLAIMLFRWPARLMPGPDLSGEALFRAWQWEAQNE